MVLLGALLGFAGVAALADDCGGILPRGATATTGLYLCGDGTAARDERYACRDYRTGETAFRVLFRGGTAPSQAYEFAPSDATPTRLAVAGRRCEQARPAGVPATAQYRGTGVCADEHGRPLPCSLFEHAGAREPEAMRYFVYYDPDGSGIRCIDALAAGRNEHALDAELAFQLGQALSRTGCCGNHAKSYLAYASALFPDDGTYRAAMIALRGDDSKAQSALMAAFRRMLDSSP
jgi:hypothetical protein